MTAKLRRYASELGWPIGISLAMLALWEFAVRELGIRSIILPPPSEIAQAIIARHDLLLTHLWPSLYLTVLGFAPRPFFRSRRRPASSRSPGHWRRWRPSPMRKSQAPEQHA